MKVYALMAFGLLMSSPATAGDMSSSEATFNEYYGKVRRIDGADATSAAREAAKLFDASYLGFLENQGLEKSTPEALHFFIRATAARHFYTHDARDVSAMHAAVGALASAGQDTQSDWDTYFRSLILARDFDQAALVQMRFKDWLPALPSIVLTQERTSAEKALWDVDVTSKSLVRQSVDVSRGMRLVVISHPACRFSRAAMIAFESDPELRVLPVLWVVPPERDLNFDLVGSWNSDHPTVPVRLVDRTSQWNFKHWSTPTFYVLKDGEVVGQGTGWAIDGRSRADVVDLISQARSADHGTAGEPGQ